MYGFGELEEKKILDCHPEACGITSLAAFVHAASFHRRYETICMYLRIYVDIY
jgi:hypothetical protein